MLLATPEPPFIANGLLVSGSEYAPSTEMNLLIANPTPYEASRAPAATPNHSGRPSTAADDQGDDAQHRQHVQEKAVIRARSSSRPGTPATTFAA